MSQMEMETKDLQNLADVLEECRIDEEKRSDIVLRDHCDLLIEAQFPRQRSNNIPPVFLHKPVKFAPLIEPVVNMGIQFYRPNIGTHYTKICCKTPNDQKALIEFFNNKQLPYHTYGLPNKRKMKVVFRGLPKDVDLDHLKKELELLSIPIVTIDKMKTNVSKEDYPLLVLVVVPNDEDGRRILKVQKFLEHNIQIEPLKSTIQQCYRCQRWGHTQRYCYGQEKCVKCAGDHFTYKCNKDPSELRPRCANCKSDHTSNYKLCPFSPHSPEYVKKKSASHVRRAMFPPVQLPRELVTQNNSQFFLRGMI